MNGAAITVGRRSVGPTPATPIPGPVAGAAARSAPPFGVPGSNFAVALSFLVLGALGAVIVAPDLARGFYLSPRVMAVTHLFTLGWITTSIMGALYQFLPVALGEPIRSLPVARVTLALYAPGLAVFLTGLLLGVTPVMLAGAGTFGAGILLFAGNLGATLRRSVRRDVTWWALAAADVFLVVTLVLGLALAGNLRWGYLGDARLTALGVHLHIALAGWVLLVMVGVAHRLLPMFLLSHGTGDRLTRGAVALIAAGSGVLAVLHHAPPLVSRWLPAVLIGSGLVCFLLQAAQFYRRRHRPALDPGMRLAAAALALLGVGLVLAAPVLMTDAAPTTAAAYVLVVVLGISLFVSAHYYKIVPFLVWYHRFGPLAGKQRVPMVSELYSGRWARVAATLLLGGAAGLTLTVGLGYPMPARLAAGVLATGVAVQGFQMFQLARRRP